MRQVSWRVSALAALAVVMFFLAGGLAASAQGDGPTIARASLRLWPEYDDPGLLVIFAGDFSEDIAFPRDVNFPLPAGARNVQAAYPDATGSLLIATSEISAGRVTYKQLPTPSFHLEYYLDRQPSGNQREIRYLFQVPYPIAVLEVSVQQPARSSDFSLMPAAETTFIGGDDLTYFVFNRANLAAGQTIEIVVRYTKTDSGVSRPQLAVTNPVLTPAVNPPQAVAQPATSSVGSWLPWALIGVGGVSLLALLAYWLFWQRQPAVGQAAGRPAPSKVSTRPAGAVGANAPIGKAAFCTQCGRPFRPDDRFCAGCGTPRRE